MCKITVVNLVALSGGGLLSDVECIGWWEQTGLGRQSMDDLRLRFSAGTISGTGVDVVGEFEVHGTVHHGDVLLKKQYVGAHQVTYFGTFDGEGTLQGKWSIFGVGGRWLIRIAGEREPAEIVDLF